MFFAAFLQIDELIVDKSIMFFAS